MTPPTPFLGLRLSISGSRVVAAGGGGYAFSDSDAEAYITAVEATGTTPTDDQKSAIDTFYVNAKAKGYFSAIQSLFFPIWASAAPNAIDLISLSSGTFNGGVTHATGYVAGDGSTGYFDTGVSQSSLGQTNSDGGMGFLGVNNVSTNVMGVLGTPAQYTYFAGSDLLYNHFGSNHIKPQIANPELITLTFHASGNHEFHYEDANGYVDLGTEANTPAFTAQANNYYAMAVNNNGAAGFFHAQQYGAIFFVQGSGMLTYESDFTGDLRAMWQSCTGISF